VPGGAPADAPFELNDPLGLRMAVVPVFQCSNDGADISGLGTAFHVDGWGMFLSADHVLSFLRAGTRLVPNTQLEVEVGPGGHALLLLGLGVVFGTVGIPNEHWAPVAGVQVPVSAYDDPLGALRGESTHRVEIDVCSLVAAIDPAARVPASVPVNLNWQPAVGEFVFACGYPQLSPSPLNPQEQQRLVEDGLHGCYGQVTALGRGDSGDRRECMFEVRADWPHGMSGGPVFNSAGEVVAVVSRSLEPVNGAPGVAHAVCLSWVPEVQRLVPRLDRNHPGHRLGYGVVSESPWNLAGVFKEQLEAQQHASRLGVAYRAVRGSFPISLAGSPAGR
jgi:serine protease Do